MTVLVTGGSGQLGRALAEAGGGLRLRVVGRPAFDFDRPETVEAAFATAAPTLVINAAAWTAVDAAEAEEAAALRANRDGPALLARLCAAAGTPLIHVSTDYVFDGGKGVPYVETDPVCPTGAYGRSKRAGEEAVLALCPRALVVRTAWVYAPHGRNFVRTILNAGRTRPVLRVVADQRGNPTNAEDLAAALLEVARQVLAGWQDRFGGIFHAAGSGDTTWHGLALAALQEAARFGHPLPEVQPIATADWPTPARRPADSRLDCTRLLEVFGTRLPPWRPSLARAVAAICAAEAGDRAGATSGTTSGAT